MQKGAQNKIRQPVCVFSLYLGAICAAQYNDTGPNNPPRVAQVALRFGADDIDGTVVEGKIYHDAGATTPQTMTRQEITRLIREAGHEPFERDTVYRPVARTETTVTVQV